MVVNGTIVTGGVDGGGGEAGCTRGVVAERCAVTFPAIAPGSDAAGGSVLDAGSSRSAVADGGTVPVALGAPRLGDGPLVQATTVRPATTRIKRYRRI